SRGRRWTAGAGALHVEKHDAILEAAERDVAAVIFDRGANAGLDQLLDGGDRLGVGGGGKLVPGSRRRASLARQKGRAGHEMLHDGAEDRRLELLPFTARLGHRDEVGTEEHTADAGDREQPLSKRRLRGPFLIAYVERAMGQDGPPRKELERGRIGGRLGLEEEGLGCWDWGGG